MPVRQNIWYRLHLGALPAHLVLTTLFTWPLLLDLLPGSGSVTPGTIVEDRDQNLWNLWWVSNALFRGRNPYITDMIYYPTPISLYYHTLNPFNGLLAAPLLPLFSLTTVYNLIVLFSFVVGGYGAFLLVHYLCGNRWAALIGSVVFAYSAYHIATMRGLLQLVSLEWVPFFVLFLLQAVYAAQWRSLSAFGNWLWRRAAPAGVSLLLIALVDWYYTMYALMLAALLTLYSLIRYFSDSRQGGNKAALWRIVSGQWLRIAICVAIFALLVSPILVPTIRELGLTSYMLPAPGAALSNSADLLAFFEPVRAQKLWGGLSANRGGWPFGANRYEVYATYTALALGAIALLGTRKVRPQMRRAGGVEADISPALPGKWFWAACVLVFFGLALGPVLQVNGKQVAWLFSPSFRLLMPYNIIEQLPALNVSRSPDRFDMPMTLCLGVLAGYGANVAANRMFALLSPARSGAFLSVGAVGLIFIELFQYPYPQRSADIPAWYKEVGQEQGDFSILELPPQDDYWHGSYRMLFQTAHGKAIFGGYISREFPHPFLESTPGYLELVSKGGEGDMLGDGPAEQLSAMALYKTRYVVLQKRPLPDRVDRPVDVSPWRDAIAKVLGSSAKPFYSDADLEVYRVPAPASLLPLLSIGDGWQPRETGPNGAFRWMGQSATLRIDAPQAENALLAFTATSLGPPRRLQILQGDHLVFDGQVGALGPQKTGPLELPGGASTLTFLSPDGTTSPSALGMGGDLRELSFAVLNARLEPVN